MKQVQNWPFVLRYLCMVPRSERLWSERLKVRRSDGLNVFSLKV